MGFTAPGLLGVFGPPSQTSYGTNEVMSDSMQEELLNRLRAYPPGQIYAVAPKHYVMRGFDYYRRGSLIAFEWDGDRTVLTARVRGGRLYAVSLAAPGHGLLFRCDCPAWTSLSNCKHVVCALITIKNLLEPALFRIHGRDRDKEDRLLSELRGSFQDRLPVAHRKTDTEVTGPDREKYEVVLRRRGADTELFVRMGRRRLTSRILCPHELRQFVSPLPSEMVYARLLGLERFLQRYGDTYPFIVDAGNGERRIWYDSEGLYEILTELDARADHVKVGKVVRRDGKEVRTPLLSGAFLFDLDDSTVSVIRDAEGWRLWHETADLLYVLDSPEEPPQRDDISFSIPLGLFQSLQLAFPAEDGSVPLGVRLKTEGREAGVIDASPSYRMTLRRSPRKDLFTLKPECLVEGTIISPASKLFGFLAAQERGFPIAFRAQMRRRKLYEAFFEMLSAKTETAAETVMKKALSHKDFGPYALKKKARDLLRGHLALCRQDQRLLLLLDHGWTSLRCDAQKELSLYRIPYGLFGWGVFKDMRLHGVMSVRGEEMDKALSLLYERLTAEGIGLFLEGKPVVVSAWEFSFDAVRRADIDWFEIRPEIRCDGRQIDEKTWRSVLGGDGMHEKDGCVHMLDARSREVLSMISDIYRPAGKGRGRQIVTVPRLQILDWIMLRKKGVTVKLPPEDEEILSRLSAFERLEDRPRPSGLKARLRQYQKDGYNWLSFLYENRFGACLADDMGLGKTLQAISLLAGIKEGLVRRPGSHDPAPHLVVLPPSLLFNWENEVRRFYPDIRIVSYTGSERSSSFEDCDVVLTTYGLVRRDLERLRDIQFDVIVFDEAQNVKNIRTHVTGAVRQLKGRFKLAMTGTPLENHIGEYYSIIDLAVPGLLGEYGEFKSMITREASPALDRIIRRTRPFVLRRTKEEMLKELPPKTETNIYLDLTEKQKALYRRTVEQVRAVIDEAYGTQTRQQAQITALTAILKLRQLCVSPRLLSPEMKEPSPKIVFLVDSLGELIEGNHSALVFSQFTSFLDVLEEDMKRHGIGYLRLDGSTPVGKRKKLIEAFQKGDGPSVFLLSLKAGGQGLNLTRASYVFHLDPWWNPAVESQASDRAHRIGQKKSVTVTRILMRHTVEEKMMALKKRKLEIFKAIVDDEGRSGKGFSITRADFDFLLG